MRRKLILTGDFGITDVYEGTGRNRTLVAVEIEGDFDLEEVDLGQYVRVEFIGGVQTYKLYCYEDPGLGLEVGDLVDVPTQYEDNNVAMVKALGRGTWTGRTSKVSARYVRQ